MVDFPAAHLLRENMRLDRVPIIVIGAGVSAGASVPTMSDVHKYLADRIGKPERDTAAEVASHLLETLRSDQTVAPRSVAVRLYRLLQAGQDKDLTDIWAKFGSDLLDGQIKIGGKPLSKVEPTAAHKWAARLALSGRAILVSLNYDGLTRLAIRQLAPTFTNRGEPRILSDEDSIRLFFTGEESKPKVTAIPVIKFRGDVFHAVCENGRCPSYSKLQPLYELFDGEGSGRRETERSRSSSSSALLRCADCDLQRRLQLTFPGIAEKEHQITSAVAALHQFCGNRIAGVIFLGFSGRWDEALTRYLIRRARALRAPAISVSAEETRFIQSATEEARFIEAEPMPTEEYYLFRPADFIQEKESEQILSSILSPDEVSEPYERSIRTKVEVSFPYDAFRVWGKPRPEKIEVKLPRESDLPAKLMVNSSKAFNGFTQVAASALESEDLKRLGRCLQLGPKGVFLREPTAASHNRLEHSAEAGLIAWIWFEALLPQARGWAATSDARLALEMAVLFHDARHLPFSHMMEEVFHELNWADVQELVCPIFKDLVEAIKATPGANGVPENWWPRVRAIQNGRSGVPWLEAIVDSAIDADKIAYVFNDALLTGQGVRLAGISPWFEDFINGQHLTEEGLIRLEDASCEAALAILQERMHLYRTIYLTPELRGLESVVRYIVTTWLEWKVPERLTNLLEDSAAGRLKPTRDLKTEAASALLWEKFKSSNLDEVSVLGTMIDDLENTGPAGKSALDEPAMEWLRECWRKLEPFKQETFEPSMTMARNAYRSLAPVGPVYFHESHLELARRIARRWRVHFPCGAIVDLAKLPKFLSTPENRSWQNGSEHTMAEQFLVPSRNPSQWHRGGRATVPLHACDFSAFELPVVQLLVLDPVGGASGASHFLYDMLEADFRGAGISVFENPQEAKAKGR